MTNGEKLKEVFYDMDYEVKNTTVLTDIDGGTWFSLEWWNAEYKEPTTKNGISNKFIIYKAKESKEIQEDLDKLSKLNEPTTKNDLRVDYTINDFNDFIKFGKKAFNVELTPIRPKGHWIEHPHEWGDNWQYSQYECSICHNWAHFDSDFCPNCGAEMREVGE